MTAEVPSGSSIRASTDRSQPPRPRNARPKAAIPPTSMASNVAPPAVRSEARTAENGSTALVESPCENSICQPTVVSRPSIISDRTTMIASGASTTTMVSTTTAATPPRCRHPTGARATSPHCLCAHHRNCRTTASIATTASNCSRDNAAAAGRSSR